MNAASTLAGVQPVDSASFDDDDELDLRAYLTVLRRRWKAIFLATVLVVGAALGWSVSQDSEYRAESDVLIRQRSTEALFDDTTNIRSAQDAERQLNNEVKVLESGTTVDAVEQAYDGPLDPDDVDASVASDTSDVVTVSLTSTDPDEAAALVNTYVEVFLGARTQQRVDELLSAGAEIQAKVDELAERIAEIRAPLDALDEQLAADPDNANLQAQREDQAERLSSQLTPMENQQAFYQSQLEDLQLTAGIAGTGGAQVLTSATAPTVPVSPKPVRDAAIALVLGLVLGVGAAFLIDNLDERIRGTVDLERAAGGLPLLALVPEVENMTPSFVAARDDGRSAAAEAYRSLRTALKFAGLDRPIKVVQVTSAVTGEGKTSTVANLAVAFAQGGDRVAVVCCDLRRPRVQERFNQELTPGFTDVLVGDCGISPALRRIEPGLYLMSAGSPPPNPSELLSTGRAATVISALAEEFDIVLLDSTPVLPVTDALVVSRLVDATVLVVDSRSTKRNGLRRALQLLGQVNAPVLGTVLNGVPTGGGYGYHYGYGYSYGADASGFAGEAKAGRRARRRQRQASPQIPRLPAEGARRPVRAAEADAPDASRGATGFGRVARADGVAAAAEPLFVLDEDLLGRPPGGADIANGQSSVPGRAPVVRPPADG